MTSPTDAQPTSPDSHPARGTVLVNPDNVLRIRAALLAEIADLQRFLRDAHLDLIMEPCGEDPVSHDVAAAVTRLCVDGADSYAGVFQQWIDNLRQVASSLTEVAHQYGYTDDELARSLSGVNAQP